MNCFEFQGAGKQVRVSLDYLLSVEKYSGRLTATSETNMTPVYLSKSGFNPAKIGSTFSGETTVISITMLSISLNIGWAV